MNPRKLYYSFLFSPIIVGILFAIFVAEFDHNEIMNYFLKFISIAYISGAFFGYPLFLFLLKRNLINIYTCIGIGIFVSSAIIIIIIFGSFVNIFSVDELVYMYIIIFSILTAFVFWLMIRLLD